MSIKMKKFLVLASLSLLSLITFTQCGQKTEPTTDVQVLNTPSSMEEYTIGGMGATGVTGANWFFKIYKDYIIGGSSLNDFTIVGDYSTHVSKITANTLALADSKHPVFSQEFQDATKKFFAAVQICRAQPKPREPGVVGLAASSPFQHFRDSAAQEVEAKRPGYHDQSILVVCDDANFIRWRVAFQNELLSNSAIEDEIKYPILDEIEYHATGLIP